MGILQTAERSTNKDSSENVIFQRHLIAYKKAAELINGTVLEIGSGEGYGIKQLISNVDYYIAIDKYNTFLPEEIKNNNKLKFICSEVPPLQDIADESIDFVVTFQVIEHIKDDEFFLSEIHRVLRPNGKLILTTPNKSMSLSRNPWHVREYDIKQMRNILKSFFNDVTLQGVFGNEKIMEYYKRNKESVRKITRYDIFNMQYWMPSWVLKIPYDILNRFNRHSLEDENKNLVANISYTDYDIRETSESCLDHFCIATKS